jgi:predicted CoA-substrate-specific enzyme activase
MACYVGIDIGAVSAEAALLVDAPLDGGQGAFEHLGRARDIEADIYVTSYARTYGKPVAAATEILDKLIAAVGADQVAGVLLTGSGAKAAAKALGVRVVNEFKAIAAGLSASGVEARTVFEMGGETSKYLLLARNEGGSYGVVDYATNGDCAAGTGSFIDQQAGRLKYAIEEVGPLVCRAERAAQIAGRCSVFAKSDMIHAQQKGYTPQEVLRGLCDAVARNFRGAVVRSHSVEAPVVFIGAVAANEAVVRAIRQAFLLGESELVVPRAYAHMPAIGAAVTAYRERRGSDVSVAAGLARMSDLRKASDSAHGVFVTSQPLNMDNVVLLRDQVTPYELSDDDSTIECFLGVDIGSVSTNVVLIDESGQVVHEIYTQTKGRPIEVVTDALHQVAARFGRRLNIRGAGTTGSGRELIGRLIGADTINDEITAHKTGATFVGQTMLGGRVPDTIFEIGGQDSKYISLQEGVVVDFTMNDACAAGTGSFLEERAEELDVAIKGEFAELALSSDAPIRLGERCTVFMERDVNSYMQRGAEKADLLAGLAYSVVYNYINRVVRGRKIGETIFFQGGTAYNDAVAAAFAAVTGKEIVVPPFNGVVGAIGAALLARDKMTAQGPVGAEARKTGTYVSQTAGAVRRSTFRGCDLSRVAYTLKEFTCNGCSNTCQIQQFDVEGEKTYWGNKCSDRFHKAVEADQEPVIDDLFAARAAMLLDESQLPPAGDGAPVVGIPMTMFALEQLPFWRTMLASCGLRTVLSEPTNKRIVQAGLDTVVAEPCFPIIAAHGHVAELAARSDVDYVLLPNIISLDTAHKGTESYLCPWHQTLPFVCRQAPSIRPHRNKLITPTIGFRGGIKPVTAAIQDCLGELGIPRSRVAAAVRAGYEAQAAFAAGFAEMGRKALARLDRTGRKGVIVIGRPYNLHDAGMNLSVPRKLREYYGVDCVPIDAIDLEPIDVTDVNDNMFWALGRRALAAAKMVRRRDNLHIIYITNFKCGPDSFITHFIRGASGKPFLTLQFDGHSNDAGAMTRCEAYLDSIGVLRPWRREQLAVSAV